MPAAARAERWFSHTAMAEEYVRMYRHYLAANQGSPDGPTGYSSAVTAGSSLRN